MLVTDTGNTKGGGGGGDSVRHTDRDRKTGRDGDSNNDKNSGGGGGGGGQTDRKGQRQSKNMNPMHTGEWVLGADWQSAPPVKEGLPVRFPRPPS